MSDTGWQRKSAGKITITDGSSNQNTAVGYSAGIHKPNAQTIIGHGIGFSTRYVCASV